MPSTTDLAVIVFFTSSFPQYVHGKDTFHITTMIQCEIITILFQNFAEGNKESQEGFSQYIRPSRRKSNPGSPGDEAGILPLENDEAGA
jgi:hypothetical protein